MARAADEVGLGVARAAESLRDEGAVAQRRRVPALVSQAAARFGGRRVVLQRPGVVAQLLVRRPERVQDVGPPLLVPQPGLQGQRPHQVVVGGARAVAQDVGASPEKKPGPRVVGVELHCLLQSLRRIRVVSLRGLGGGQVQTRFRVEREAGRELRVQPLGFFRLLLQERQPRARAKPEAGVPGAGDRDGCARRAHRLLVAPQSLVRGGEGLVRGAVSRVGRDGALEGRDRGDIVPDEQPCASFLERAGRFEGGRAGAVLGRPPALAELQPQRVAEIPTAAKQALGRRALAALRVVASQTRRVASPQTGFDPEPLPGAPNPSRDQAVDSPEPGELSEGPLVVFAGGDPQVRQAAPQPKRVEDAQAGVLGKSGGQHVRHSGAGPRQRGIGRVVGEGQHRQRVCRRGRGRRCGAGSGRTRGPVAPHEPGGAGGDGGREHGQRRAACAARDPDPRASALEVAQETTDVAVPPGGAAFEAPADDPAHPNWRRDTEILEVAGPARQALREHLGLGAPVERELARERLEENDSQRVDVSAAVHRFSGDLLGGQVVGRPDHGPGPRAPVSRKRSRHAEVGDERPVLGGDEDVGRFQVPVHDPGGVGLFEPFRDLTRDLERALEGKRAVPLQNLAQRTAVDEVHRQESEILVLADVVDPDDAAMRDLAGENELAAEALDDGWVGREVGPQDLQGDRNAELLVERPVDHPHPAEAHQPVQPVAARDQRPRSETPRDVDVRLRRVGGGGGRPGAITRAGGTLGRQRHPPVALMTGRRVPRRPSPTGPGARDRRGFAPADRKRSPLRCRTRRPAAPEAPESDARCGSRR